MIYIYIYILYASLSVLARCVRSSCSHCVCVCVDFIMLFQLADLGPGQGLGGLSHFFLEGCSRVSVARRAHFTEQGQDNSAHFNEGGGGGVFADKSTMGLAFEMAAVVLNSACASSSFSDMLLVGCFHYHVLPTRPEPPPTQMWPPANFKQRPEPD